MPKLARWYIKSALVYLVLGALIAALALSGAAVPLPQGLLALRPLAWHMLTLGWATQLIFGVAFWMFPHLSKEQPRGDERWPWAAFWALNTGLADRAQRSGPARCRRLCSRPRQSCRSPRCTSSSFLPGHA